MTSGSRRAAPATHASHTDGARETGTAPTRPPVFVGREHGYAEVIASLSRAPSLVLIEGEAGIGKSRLPREVLASQPAATAMVAACPPLTDPFPLGPVVDGLRTVWEHSGPVELSPLGGALRTLFPE